MKQLYLMVALFATLVSGVSAKEFSAAEERVMGAYLAFYGRPADAEGLDYWSNRLTAEGGNLDSIIGAFGESKEYTNRFGGFDDGELVANLYQQLLGREPDNEGLAFYVDKLDSGSMSLQKISMAILDGVTGSDASTVSNKLAFSKLYAVDNSSGESNLSSVQLSSLIASIDHLPQTLDKVISVYQLGPQAQVAAPNDSANTGSENTNKGANDTVAIEQPTPAEPPAPVEVDEPVDNPGKPPVAEEPDAVKDQVAPVLAFPENILAEAEGANTVVAFSVTAEDVVDGAVDVGCSPASGSVFSVGQTNVSCGATDSAGNSVEGTFIVNIVDSVEPQLTLPENMTIEAEVEGSVGEVVNFSVTATDVVDGRVPVSCSASSGSQFEVGATVVSCSAQDRSGNAVSGSFSVNVLAAVVVPSTTTVNLSWSVPTTRENGEPLLVGELAGYEIYIIAEASGLDQVVPVSDPLSTSQVIDDLASDTYHFSISSIDTDGLRSSPSGLITTIISN